MSVPLLYKTPCPKWKTIAAIGVTDLKNLTRHAGSLSDKKREAAVAMLDNREQGNWALFDRHLHGKTFPNLPVIDLQRSYPDSVLSDSYVARAIMAHQNQISIKVHCVVLSEGAAHTEKIHNLHRYSILYLVLPSNRHPISCEHGRTEDDGTHCVLVLLNAATLIVVGQKIELLLRDQLIESDRCPRCPPQLLLGTVVSQLKEVAKSIKLHPDCILLYA